MRILTRSMWNVIVLVLNVLVFVLIGLQLSGGIERLQGYAATQLASDAVLLGAVAIVVRFGWVYAALYLPRTLGAALRGFEEELDYKESNL